ncbi:MAG: hypothetical protein R3C10_00540 [Pirellulales bacterium]
MRSPERAERQEDFEQLVSEMSSLPGGAAWTLLRAFAGQSQRSQIVGEVFSRLYLVAYDSFADAQDRAQHAARTHDRRGGGAVYRAENGSYPDAAGQARAELLDEVPRDVFSGEPLHYELRGDGYLLYSVGPDGENDGGTNSRSRSSTVSGRALPNSSLTPVSTS